MRQDEYQIVRRFERARLIREADDGLSLTDVAARAGLSDHSQLSRRCA